MVDTDQIAVFDVLNENTAALKAFFKGVDQNHIKEKPSAEMWSMAECLEHILVIDKAVKSVFNGPCLEVNRNPGLKIKKIKRDFLNFEKKYNAPGVISPKGEIDDIEGMLNAIEDIRADIMRSNELHLECQAFQHALFGHLTKLEWIWFIIIHTQRHLEQLKRINSYVSSKL